MNAPEKIQATVAEFTSSEPADAQTVMLQELARQAGPSMLAQYLGDDPAAVDTQLAAAALFVLGHRSDDAPPVVSAELLEAAGVTPEALEPREHAELEHAKITVHESSDETLEQLEQRHLERAGEPPA
jgi:hypothetical protein